VRDWTAIETALRTALAASSDPPDSNPLEQRDFWLRLGRLRQRLAAFDNQFTR
jgi:hypothetical protein